MKRSLLDILGFVRRLLRSGTGTSNSPSHEQTGERSEKGLGAKIKMVIVVIVVLISLLLLMSKHEDENFKSTIRLTDTAVV